MSTDNSVPALRRQGLTIMPPVMTMRSGADQVNGGLPGGFEAGWLSGNLASALANDVRTIVFDLGPDWQQYRDLLIAVTGTQPLASINESASDDGVAVTMPLPGSAPDGSLTLTLGAAGTVIGETLVCGRYVIVNATNGANAQGATAVVRLVAYPS